MNDKYGGIPIADTPLTDQFGGIPIDQSAATPAPGSFRFDYSQAQPETPAFDESQPFQFVTPPAEQPDIGTRIQQGQQPEPQPVTLQPRGSILKAAGYSGLSGAARGVAEMGTGLSRLEDIGPRRNTFMEAQHELARAGSPAVFAESTETGEPALDIAGRQLDTAHAARREELMQPGKAVESEAGDVATGAKSLADEQDGIKWLNRGAEIVGGFVPFLATGPAAPIAGGLQATGGTYEAAYDAYKKQGFSDEDAKKKADDAAFTSGLASGELFLALPGSGKAIAERLFAEQLKTAKPVVQAAIRTLSQSTEGSAVLAANSLVNSAQAKISYNPDLTLNEALESAAKDALAGFAGTAVVHAPGEAIGLLRRGQKPPPGPPTPPSGGAPLPAVSDINAVIRQQVAPTQAQPAEPPVQPVNRLRVRRFDQPLKELNNAIQIGSPATPNVGEAPQDSGKVGEGIPVVQPEPANAQAQGGQTPQPNAAETQIVGPTEIPPGRKLLPAVLTESGKIFTGLDHIEATEAAGQAGESWKSRGYIDTSGKFLSLTELSRQEMDRQAAAKNPENPTPLSLKSDYERYQELLVQLEQLKTRPVEEQFASPIPKQIEEIKNRNGGMPPKPQVVDQPVNKTEPVQKYKVGNNPQTWTLLEKLPQSAVEKEAGEQPVTVKNDKTGKTETMLESDLTPVKTGTGVKAPARDLDSELRSAKLDPSVFQNDAQKREALKRQYALKGRPVVEAKPVEPPVELNPGDRVTFTPADKKYTPTAGLVQDVIKNTEGEVGYHILSPKPGDPTRVVRVWLKDGKIEKSGSPVQTVEQMLTADTPDDSAARNRLKVIDRRQAELRDDYKKISDEIKEIEKRIKPQRGGAYARSRIKSSAKKSDVARYDELQKNGRAIGNELQQLDEDARTDRRVVDAAVDAGIITDQSQPLLRRLDRKVRELGAKASPELLAALKAETARVILEKYPDATADEISKMTPQVHRAAYFGGDPMKSTEIPTPQSLRMAELDAAVNGPMGQSSLSEDLQSTIKRFRSASRAYGEEPAPNAPVEPLTPNDVASIKSRITKEVKAIQVKAEADRIAAAEQKIKDDAEAAKMLEEAERVAKSESGVPAKVVKSGLVSRIESAISKLIDSGVTIFRKEGESDAELGDHYLAQNGDNAAMGWIKPDGKKFKVQVKALRDIGSKSTPWFTAKVDTMEEAEWIFKAMASEGTGKAVIGVPGDGVFQLLRSGKSLLNVWTDAKKINISSGDKRAPYSTEGGIQTPPSAIKTKGDWKEALDFFELKESDTVADRSNAMAELAKKVNPESPETVTVKDVNDYISKPKGERQAQLPISNLGEPEVRTIRPTTAVGLDEIRQAFSDPRLGYAPDTVRVALDLLNQKFMSKLDRGRLILAIRQRLEDNARGQAWVLDNLIEMSGSANPTTFPHEVAHLDYEVAFTPEEKEAINELRLDELRKRFGPNIPPELEAGTMTSDAFKRSGLPHDLYSLISPSEFTADYFGERFSKESWEGRNNKPSTFWENIRDKFRAFFRALVFWKKRQKKIDPPMEPYYQKWLSGNWKPTVESGVAYERAVAERQAQLAKSPATAQEILQNEDELGPEVSAFAHQDIQAQNGWTQLPGIKALTANLPEGVRSKLNSIFGKRDSVFNASRQKSPQTVDLNGIMADPRLSDEQKMTLVGDIVKNNLDAESQIASKQARADLEIARLEGKVRDLAKQKSELKSKGDIAAEAVKKGVNDLQIRMVQSRKASQDIGEMEALNEGLKQVESLKNGSTALNRVYADMAENLPDEILSNPNVTPEQLAAEYRKGRTDEQIGQTLGVTPEMVNVASRVMLADQTLSEQLFSIKHSDDYSKVMTDLQAAAKNPDRNALSKFVSQIGGQAGLRQNVSRMLRSLNPKLNRALRSVSDWQQVKGALANALLDPAWRQYREQAYALADVRGRTVSYNGDISIKFKNPLTGSDVEIPTTLDVATQKENIGKLKSLLDDARAYLADPTAPGYDPKTALAWRHIVDTADGFWLNPDINPAMPHVLPYHLELPRFFRAPQKILRTSAAGSREGREVQVRLNALSAVDAQLKHLENTTGVAVHNANRRAAESHKMTVDDWYDTVFNELAGKAQYIGQVPLKLGDKTLSGETINTIDIAAMEAQKLYTDKARSIAEKAGGNAAVAVNPARITADGITRKAVPSSPVGWTLPQIASERGTEWLRQWRKLRTDEQRLQWLNREENFGPVFMSHLDMNATPLYRNRSQFAPDYRGIVSEYRDGGINDVNDAAKTIFEAQDFTDETSQPKTQDEIRSQLIAEIGNVFDTLDQTQKEIVERQKADPKISVFSADNAFTLPRPDAPSVPYTFTDYGVKDTADRLGLMNDAKAFYALELVGREGALQRLTRAYADKLAEYEARFKAQYRKGETGLLFPKRKLQKETVQEVFNGDELYDYNQLRWAIKRIGHVRAELERIYTQEQHSLSIAAEKLMRGGLKFIGANVLMTPGSRITHTLGNLFAWGKFYKTINQSWLVRPVEHVVRLAGTVARDMALANPEVRKQFEKAALNKSWASVIPGVRRVAGYVMDRQAEIERLNDLGIAGGANMGSHLAQLGMAAKRIFQRTPEGVVSKVARLPGQAVDTLSTGMLAAFPQYNDLVLHSQIMAARQAMEDRLKVQAVEAFDSRKALARGTGANYGDFSDPMNFLTPQELTGSLLGKKQDARRLRNLFSENGLDVDAIMYRYHLAVEAAKAKGEDAGNIPFLTPDEQNTLDFAIGQETGLSTIGTRLLISRKGAVRQLLSYIHGLGLWQADNIMDSFNKVSGQKASNYVPYLVTTLVGGVTWAVVLGLIRQSTTAAVNKALFNRSSSLPTLANLIQQPNAEDAAKLAMRAGASWMPFVGDLVNGVMLNTPDRFGHLDSQFIGWNLVTDILKTTSDMIHSGNISDNALNLVGRWSPMTRIVINKLPSRTGLNDAGNVAADIRAAVPDSMEAKMREGGTQFQPTATSGIVREMLNAAYKGDDAAFMDAYNRAVEQKRSEGVKNPEAAVRESFLSHNPYLSVLKTLPTDDERQTILARMTPGARSEVANGEQVIAKYGAMIGGNPAFTIESRDAQRGAVIGLPRGGGIRNRLRTPRGGAMRVSYSAPRMRAPRLRVPSSRFRASRMPGARRNRLRRRSIIV